MHKTMKLCGLTLLFVMLITMCFALTVSANSTKTVKTNHKTVVTSSRVRLYQSPSKSSKIVCILPKGIPMRLLGEKKKFYEVNLSKVGRCYVQQNKVKLNKAVIKLTKKQKKLIKKGIKEARTVRLRKLIVAEAKKYVGKLPYIYGCSDLSYGADCSGFTSAIYRKYHINISRSSVAQTWEGKGVSLKDIQPGDIVCYPYHVALYAGNNLIIHATTPGQYVQIAHMNVISPIIRIVRYI